MKSKVYWLKTIRLRVIGLHAKVFLKSFDSSNTPRERLVFSLGHYILLGVSIPNKSSAFSSVILNELTRHNLVSSNFSSSRPSTLFFS